MNTYNTQRVSSGLEENLKLIISNIHNNYQARLEYSNELLKNKLVYVGTPAHTDWKAVNNVINFANLQLESSNVNKPSELTSNIWKIFYQSKQPELF